MALSDFEELLKSLHPHSLLPESLSRTDFTPLNLSVDNKELKSVDVGSVEELQKYVWQVMKLQNAKVAYGGYLEKRGIYRRSDYFNQEDAETERNIHLGLDLWIKAGTPVFSPLEGHIHSFKNNTNYGDYGPCIILEHHLNGFKFYTLYGHLSLESLIDKEVGTKIQSGEQIATLGIPEVNGNYPPHLHFQIIKDLQDNYGDYPGVTNKLDLEFYKKNCPDPNWLLNLI